MALRLLYRLFPGGFRRRRRRLNKLPALGLNSEYRNDLEQGGGEKVVKGTARRVIVVKSPDPKIFEEAIFIIREDIFSGGGVSSAQLMREAQRVAAGYARRKKGLKRLFARLPGPAIAAAGAAATGIAWLAVRLLV